MSRDVRIHFYGNLNRLAGGRTRTVTVQRATPSVSELRAAIARQVPEVAPQLDHCALGVGTELLDEDASVPEGADVSVLPPVSGGLS